MFFFLTILFIVFTGFTLISVWVEIGFFCIAFNHNAQVECVVPVGANFAGHHTLIVGFVIIWESLRTLLAGFIQVVGLVLRTWLALGGF